MPVLVAPMPLLPAFELDQPQPPSSPSPRRLASPPPIYCTKNEINISYARLRSPSLPPEPCLSMSKPSCSSTSRRRSKASSHSLRRRRHIPRVDYRVEHPPLHAFDKLPWIASLDTPPENIHPCDIADLSLLPDPATPPVRPSGPGPVRRRKVSPRSSPMIPSIDEQSGHHLLACNLCPGEMTSRPSTPPPRFDSAHITFRHLMPVADDDASLNLYH